MDVHEDTNKNTVTATFELPGLKKEDVQIDLHNNVLTVSGETRISSERDENGYAVRERRYGKFSRSLGVPSGLQVGSILCIVVSNETLTGFCNRRTLSKPIWRTAS